MEPKIIDARVEAALLDLKEATDDKIVALTSLGRVRAEAVKVYREALLNSEEGSVAGRKQDAEIATRAIDAQAVLLAHELQIHEAKVHLLTVTIQALT